jgi:uncharacterized protein
VKRILSAILFSLAVASGILWWNRQKLLVHAAVRGDVPILKGLLAVGADPNFQGTGSTPLFAAAWNGRIEAAACLLARGANINAVEPSGVTPLMAAAARGDEGMVRLLLDRGADSNAQAPCGTALDLARANGRGNAAAILEEAASRGR